MVRSESPESPITADERIRKARNADMEALRLLVRDTSAAVIEAAVLNRNLTEGLAITAARNRAAGPDTLGFLSQDVRFRDSYRLKAVLCRNPKTPQKVALGLMKFLRIFDLADIAKDQNVPVALRQKAEQVIAEKIPSLPAGVKTTLAKRASGTVLMMLMEHEDGRAIHACLDSPALTEGHLYKVLGRPDTGPLMVRIAAEHPKWSLRYMIRYSLIRNFYTPMNAVVRFIRGMKTSDLKELYHDPKTPVSTRPFIFRELFDREESPDESSPEIYEISPVEEEAAGSGGAA